MTRRDATHLLDMLAAAKMARKYVGEAEFAGFQNDDLVQSAVIRQIGIIGEAAKRVSEETREAHPGIPWSEIVGMRNVLIHAYDSVDLKEVWTVIERDLPRLISQIEPLIPPEPEK